MNNQEVNKELLWHLNQLIQYSPPSELKLSLESIFQAYLLSLGNEAIPLRLKETITDYYCLMDFIEELESIDLN